MGTHGLDFLCKALQREIIILIWWGGQTFQAAKADAANLLARTRLRAPIKVGSLPSVEGRIRAEGRPRRTLCSMVRVRASSTNGQARAISPPTTTASGLKPTTRFEIPIPRQSAMSIKA